MRSLVLVGASGLAREVLMVELARGRYDDLVIVDDDPGRWGSSLHGVKVVGPIAIAAEPGVGDVVVCIGSGQGRRQVVERLAALGVTGARYATVVDPSVRVPPTCTVGRGSVLLAGVVLTCDVHIHRHVVVMPNVTLTHDDVISDYATLCAGVSLGGEVTVEPAAYLGMNSSVRQRLTVGTGGVLGMGAVLLRHLPAGETWVGVPAANHAAQKELVP
jgi:sugar O-acyltransferase (sialic acid O-acetyltransferase NeuD family)